jgi:hypothetical protein
MYRFAAFVLSLALAGAGSVEAPQVQIEAPPQLASVRARLDSGGPQRFADVARLVGVSQAGPAIHVSLIPESLRLARITPPWIEGFTEQDVVVLFPARTPSYPDASLEDVLRHEVAHALIWRVSGGRPIPRWFNEGLAMAAERQRGIQDQTELLYQLVTGSRTDLSALDRLFDGSQSDQTRAYALAGALVRNLLQQHGPSVCAAILQRVGGGESFDNAFSDVIGVRPATANAEFWQHQSFWTDWLPILTSTDILWIVVTVIALVAIYRRQRKNREIEKRWEEEEDDESRYS